MPSPSDRLPAYHPREPKQPPPPIDFTKSLGQHALLLAPPGIGKTQFIQSLALKLLEEEHPPSLIILNSQGKMLKNIERLALFAPGQPLSDRLVIIDPEDDQAPALNMFALPTERLSSYSWIVREQLEASTYEIFQYLFTSLASDLTGKQSTAFQPLITLMLSIPGATFNTFLDILQDVPKDERGKDDPTGASGKYALFIDGLEDHERGFFRTQYFTPAYTRTRQEIQQRIYRVVNRRGFRRMFASPVNKFDLFSLINRGSVILVNTSRAWLGDEGSAFFGRWVVSLLIRAAYERVAIERPRRTFLLIDEASDYVDQSFEKLLSKVRQFNVGCLMAFQETGQISILKSVMAMTAVKLCGKVEHQDATVMAPNMHTTPDFLKALSYKADVEGEFACYVRGVTETAIRIKLPYGAVENAPQMTPAQHQALRERNRERYSAPAAPQVPPATPLPSISKQIPLPARPTSEPPAPEPEKKINLDKPPDTDRKW